MPTRPAFLRRFDRTLRAITLIAGGVTLTAMTGLSVFNVLIMRKGLNAPIQGAEDILILMLVVVVAISIPFGARAGAHIEIEMLEPVMSPMIARVSLVLMKMLGFALLVVMAWRLWESGTAAERFGETTQQLLISYEPFYYVLAVSIGLYAIVLLIEIGLLLTGRDLGHHSLGGDV
ncbi:TRAP transporter small permease [Nioella aestuarii]|uniref:TRAP transporter small permease n=1 Tax=Nioella aestuarii TaxID=1662864 RepID=UPI003D7FB617